MTIYQVIKLVLTQSATFHIGRDNDGKYKTEYEFFRLKEDAEKRREHLQNCAREIGVESTFVVNEVQVK